MTYAEVVREYFPDADNDFVDYVLWEKTGFPEFWNIGVDGNTPEECLRKQLQDFEDKVGKMIATYKGKPIQELTKEELIIALNGMDEFYKSQLENKDKIINLYKRT